LPNSRLIGAVVALLGHTGVGIGNGDVAVGFRGLALPAINIRHPIRFTAPAAPIKGHNTR
jgi:hypothetical protein